MSVRIAVAQNVPGHGSILEMSKRVVGLQMATDAAEADGLVCDDIESAMNAAQSGTHVLLLQPFQVSEPQVNRLSQQQRIVPALTGRFVPSRQQIKQEVNAGNLGQPGLIRLHEWDASEPLDDSRLAQNLDVVCWLMHATPSTVYAVQSHQDYLQVHLGFDGDAMALIDMDASDAVRARYQSLHLIGSAGAAYADDHHNAQLVIKPNGMMAALTAEGEHAWVNLLRWFSETIRSDSLTNDGWSHVALVNRLVGSVRRSIQARESVVVGAGHE